MKGSHENEYIHLHKSSIRGSISMIINTCSKSPIQLQRYCPTYFFSKNFYFCKHCFDTWFSFQAVHSLVGATDASVAGEAATGLPSVSSSTADDLILEVTYPLDQRSWANFQVTKRVSERPTAAVQTSWKTKLWQTDMTILVRYEILTHNCLLITGKSEPRTVP